MTFKEKIKNLFNFHKQFGHADKIAFPAFRSTGSMETTDSIKQVFPEEHLSPREKIFYSLLVEGTQSGASLTLRTGLRANEFIQALNELINEGKIIKKGYFYSNKDEVTRDEIISFKPITPSNQ